MAYHSPLSYNFKLEASISAAKILEPKKEQKRDEIALKNSDLSNCDNGKGDSNGGGSRKRKRKGSKRLVQGSAPKKHCKRMFTYFLKNPSTPEFLLDDRKIRPLKRNEMDELEGLTSAQLRNVIRECLCTCFNFFYTNIDHRVVEIVRTAIARSWAAVDLMTYSEVVNESVKKYSKLQNLTKLVFPPRRPVQDKEVQTPHCLVQDEEVQTPLCLVQHEEVQTHCPVQDKEMQTDAVKVNDASTMTDTVYTMLLPVLSEINPSSKAQVGEGHFNEKVWTPAVLINGFEAKDLIKALLLTKNLMNLDKLGLGNLIKVKTNLNRSIVITVTGTIEQAEILCNQLKEVLWGFKSEMYVLTSVMLYNLEKSTATETVLQVLSSIAETPIHNIFVGERKINEYDKINLCVKCPVTAAKKMVSLAPFVVENSSVSARIISNRSCPVSCTKCLMNGHTRRNCTSEVDRSNLCYRCGKKIHLSVYCSEPLCCPVCKDLFRPSDHLVGSENCFAAHVPVAESDALST